MQVHFQHQLERNLWEVHYASGSAIGYRFDAGFLLTASEDLKLTEPEFVQLQGDRRPARVLATRTDTGGRVTLLGIEHQMGVLDTPILAGQEWSDALFEIPATVDFVSATARWAGGETTGHLLSWSWDRRIDFVAENESAAVSIGTPVFLDDVFVGLVARRRRLPEQWFLATRKLLQLLGAKDQRKRIEAATGKLLGEQVLALLRSLRSDVTRLWSLHELLADEAFARYLRKGTQDGMPQSAASTLEAGNDAATTRSEPVPAAPAFETARLPVFGEMARQTDSETAIIDSSPRNMWVSLERSPRLFPLGPSSRVGTTIALFLIAIAIAITLFGRGLPYWR